PQPRPVKMLVALSLLAALVGGTVGTSATLLATRKGDATSTIVERVAPKTSKVSAQSLTGVAAVAQKVIPSVVLIDVTTSTGRFGMQSSGTGSGVIFTSDGYIVTSNHVVEGAGSIHVTLATGGKLPARLVGSASPVDDIAVIKVDRSGLEAATLGSTAQLSVGDVAVALGSPFGLQGTVTAGVISAMHRNIDLGDGERLTDAIQTDAPINPGNSGGALADASGNVIGINTAIVGSGSGNVGVGFAIPIDIARRDAEQIIKTGHAERPFVGISGESLPNQGGALVQQVVSGGPADKAGLKVGDIIVGIEGMKIGSMEYLITALSRLESGQTVELTYLRDGKKRTATATLTSASGG
ncbi:MAG: trypsin-like peptidase domain-containing protein, partial [Actinomycetota bacterium]